MNSWMLPDNLTVKRSSLWLNLGREKLQSGIFVFDMSQVNQVDSSFIAALLHWAMLLKKQNKQGNLQLLNVPSSLISLLSLYEMTELIKNHILL
jgi:ABC-type transporter Mla MlaB component